MHWLRWTLCLLLALPAPAALVVQTLAYDTGDRESTRDAAVVRGEVLDFVTLAPPADAPSGWPADQVWRFRVEQILEPGARGSPQAGQVIEVHKELYARRVDDPVVPGRRMDLALEPYERHIPETGNVYWSGWWLADARHGDLWTVQERHLASAGWLALASLAGAALVGVALHRGKLRMPAVVLACGAGVAVALLAGANGNEDLTQNDGEGNLWASPLVLVLAALAIGLCIAASTRRATALALAITGLAYPLVAAAMRPGAGLADDTWASAHAAVAVAVAIGWAAAAPWRWAGFAWCAAGGALALLALELAVFGQYQPSPVGALMAVGLWGIPAAGAALLLGHAVTLLRQKQGRMA